MRENESKPGESVLLLNSDIAELERLTAFLDAFCQSEGISDDICYQLQIALEELVINAIKYGGCEPKEGAIRLAIWKAADEVRAVLSDSGTAFNPLDAPSPDLTKSLRDRPVGGLGIHIARNLMASIRYERREGRNYLYLTKPVNSDRTHSPQRTHANRNGNNQS